MSPLQRRALAGIGLSVSALIIFGIGQGSGANSIKQDRAKPKTITITKTVTKTVQMPGPTQIVSATLSADCVRYLNTTDELVSEFSKFTAGYGGLADQLNLSFDAIETRDEASLNAARIKVANMDHAASNALSNIIDLSNQAAKLRAVCPQAH